MTKLGTKIEVADLGTGCGMPDILVKIALPGVDMTLVESITKKCKFLKNINNKLALGMKILNTRAEEIGRSQAYIDKCLISFYQEL